MPLKSRLCFSVFVGAADRTGRGRFSSRRETALRNITKKYFPTGATILNAKGTWVDPASGEFVDEEARQILVCAPSRRSLRPWCQALLTALDQKELLVVQLGTAASFSARKPHARHKPLKRSATAS
jgi:hypothetical protein